MDNKDFDAIIKEAMASLESTEERGSWELMKAHMAHQDPAQDMISDEALDAQIKQSLDNFSVPFNADHQDVMFQKYEKYLQDKKNIFYTRLSRVAIVLLLMFTTIHFNRVYDFLGTQEVQFVDVYVEQESTSSIVEVAPDLGSSTVVAKNIFSKKNITSDVFLDRMDIVTNYNSTLPNVIKAYDSSNEALIVTHYNSVNNHSQFAPLSNSTSAIANNEVLVLGQDKLSQPHSIVSISDMGIAYTGHIVEMDDHKIISKTSLEGKTYISVWASKDLDRTTNPISTPLSGGYTLGMNVEERIGNLSIKTGIEFSNEKFKPEHNSTLFGSINDLKSVNVMMVNRDVLSIPIDLKYTTAIGSKTEIYATVGAKYNSVLKNHNASSIEDASLSRDDIHESIPRNRPNDLGVIQGGSLIKNSFITGSFGLGVEHQLSSSLVAFAEPNIQAQIYPISTGLSQNGIGKLSLKLGVKMRI